MVVPAWLLAGLALAALGWLFLKSQNKQKEDSLPAYSQRSQKTKTRDQGVQCSLATEELEEVWHSEQGKCFHVKPDCQDLKGRRKVVAKRRCKHCG